MKSNTIKDSENREVIMLGKIQEIVGEHGATLFMKGRGDNQAMICGKQCPNRIMEVLTNALNQQRREIVGEISRFVEEDLMRIDSDEEMEQFKEFLTKLEK